MNYLYLAQIQGGRVEPSIGVGPRLAPTAGLGAAIGRQQAPGPSPRAIPEYSSVIALIVVVATSLMFSFIRKLAKQ